MTPSEIKLGINVFLNEIKFNKENYSLYNNIFDETRSFNDEIFIFIILQLAYQTNFHGYFDDLYIDIINRKSHYIKELIHNFRISYIGTPTLFNKINNFIFLCGKISERELYFNRKIRNLDFDNIFKKYIDLNDTAKKANFIYNCEKIYNNEFQNKLTKIKRGSSRVYPM